MLFSFLGLKTKSISWQGDSLAEKETLPTSGDGVEHTVKTGEKQSRSGSKRRLWYLVGGALTSQLLVHGVVPFLSGEKHVSGAKDLKYQHNSGVDGYLQSFINDAFKLAPAYIADPPAMKVHPAIYLADEMENLHRKQKGCHHKTTKHPKHFPIPPKVAEGIFLKVPNETSCMEASRRYTYQDHKAASGNQHILALRLKQEFEQFFGLPVTGPFENVFDAGSEESQRRIRETQKTPQVWIDTYYPVMNEPVSRELSILSEDGRLTEWSGKLREDIIDEDPFSKFRDSVPVFHGLSTSGNVTAQVVYAGYGRKADFDALAKAGVEVKGKIVLVKYGAIFRGLKVKGAEDAGALACLIYSDPGDDGPMTEENGEKPYPDGKARQPNSVQRGSVQYLSLYPGDPTTPNTPAYPNATRIEGGNIPQIPSLPISYSDAIPLLKLLEKKGIKGADLGETWEGGLKHRVEYWTGPSERTVRVVNEVDTKVMPIWNVMAVIPGYLSDEAVLIGNHIDAWTLGAADPNSGTAVTHEIYKGLGTLTAKGWKPLRTIYIGAWDAEEYGLMGSTEFAEDFASWIPENLVAYLNLDSSGAGTIFGASASPSLANLMKATSQEILYPGSDRLSVWAAGQEAASWSAYKNIKPERSDDGFEALFTASQTGIPSLGSGSDYTPFLQHLGVASSDGPGFSPGPGDAVYHYHSVYDNQYWMEKYGDPGFSRHIVTAKILGLVLLRVADSLVVPLNITQYAFELSDYKNKVEYIHKTFHYSTPLNLTKLDQGISSVQAATVKLNAQTSAALDKLSRLTHHGDRKHVGAHSKAPCKKQLHKIRKVLKEIQTINRKISKFEAGFLGDGLKGREWYKHTGTAPGRWLGYGATTFPSITEALTLDASVEEAQSEADKVAELLFGIADRLEV
ncbi:Transferrin receptor and related proteins containing the protease-associated (PA) domain [Phaffia rhodozyma]|uniref:Transferrin receptor and related proteins containing the protease-associated (PA) domain n=1 Tax=Phaffia rhodozyma TaxID=264483 RepID=A0A0F7SG41_PHARH|nr:Transferrin receptor and related proteins containing the protease-associated (PA) domain [Phaffia rhodozyma]